jgi:tRNA(fMet)-specific endonuclease VapC
MSGKFLLDTNILIGLFANDQDVVTQLRSNINVFIPSIVLGELYYGAFGSIQVKENILKIHQLANKTKVIDIDKETAIQYGEIKNYLKSNGTPIPENDIWIAALANQYRMKLVSRDSHFDKIEKIQLIKW